MRNYCGIDSHEPGCNCIKNAIYLCNEKMEKLAYEYRGFVLLVNPDVKTRNRMLNFLFLQREYETYILKSRSIGFTEGFKSDGVVLKPYDYGSNYHRQSIMNYLTNKYYA